MMTKVGAIIDTALTTVHKIDIKFSVMFTLVVVLGTRAGIYAGRYRVPYEILPDYAGPTFGLMNMIGQSSGFVTPLITSAFTRYARWHKF